MAFYHLLVLSFLFLGETGKPASGTDIRLDQNRDISSTSYICKENFYLNVTFLRSIFVLDPLHCAFECSKTDKCFSVNLQAVRNKNGYFSCELLPGSMVNHLKQLKTSIDYHHYEFKTPCLTESCGNGGSCVAKHEEDEFRCVCLPGYTGRNCEQDIDEYVSEAVNPCHVNADCTKTVGSYFCKCRTGYIGDGKNCTKDLELSAILKANQSYVTALATMLFPVKSNTSSWIRCWRAQTDGWSAATFHSQCDNKGATVTIIQVGEYVFGGYIDVSWDVRTWWKRSVSEKAFLYSLRNYDNLSPFKMPLIQDDFKKNAIRSSRSDGPVFGYGYAIKIANNAGNNNDSITNPGRFTYRLPTGYTFDTLPAQRLLTGSDSKYFKPTDLEVFYESFH